jgi:hypothetical protein
MASSINPPELRRDVGRCFRPLGGRPSHDSWNEIRLRRLRAVNVSARTLITLEDAETWLSSLPEVQRPNVPGRCAKQSGANDRLSTK